MNAGSREAIVFLFFFLFFHFFLLHNTNIFGVIHDTRRDTKRIPVKYDRNEKSEVAIFCLRYHKSSEIDLLSFQLICLEGFTQKVERKFRQVYPSVSTLFSCFFEVHRHLVGHVTVRLCNKCREWGENTREPGGDGGGILAATGHRPDKQGAWLELTEEDLPWISKLSILDVSGQRLSRFF